MVTQVNSKDPTHLTDEGFPSLPWYDWWIQSQLAQQPKELFACIQDFDHESEEISFDAIKSVYSKVSTIIINDGELGISDIVQKLLDDGRITVAKDVRGIEMAMDLVFSITGWQTMLYRPDVFSCPPSELCIADEMDGYRGEAHICLKQSRISSNRRLSDFLLGFGLMLPPRNHHTFEDVEEMKNFSRLKSVDSSTLNMHLLVKIGGISVNWTDCLACHLELDKNERALYLFRYPSFCVANLRNRSTDGNGWSVIHSCASSLPSNTHWAASQDVTELLQEIVLSYRLLFNQHVKSRELLRKLRPFKHVPLDGHDDFLLDVCGKKQFNSSLGIIERDTYELARDFAHLRSRIVRLNTYLDDRKPRSWRELWLDNRDSASWLTFWAVIVVGGMGLILSFLQLVFQIVQVAMAVRQPGS